MQEAQLRKKFDVSKAQLEGAIRTAQEQFNASEKQRKAAESARQELASRADALEKQLESARTSAAGGSQVESLNAELVALRAKATEEERRATAAVTAKEQVDTELAVCRARADEGINLAQRHTETRGESRGVGAELIKATGSRQVAESDNANLGLIIKVRSSLG